MSVLDNLNRIKSCKDDIKQALTDRGVDMTNVAFTEYATKINEIPAGGGDYLDMKMNMSTYYSTVESVPGYAFTKCKSLQSIDLPMCITVGENAFDKCSSLQSIDLPMCSIVDNYGFSTCSSLTTVTLPKCEEINAYAFAACSSLQSIDLPMCITVGQNAFDKCSSLQSIDLPSLSSLRYNAFANCFSLSEVYIPICIFIDGYAFASCSSLSVLDLRSTYSCTLSNSNAFSRTQIASGIGSIYVHNTVLSQFQNATNWAYFSNRFVGVGDPDKPLLSFVDGRVYGDTGTFNINWKSYLGITNSVVKSVDLPNVERLSANAGFSYFSNLTEVSMDKLISAPNQMCYSCSSLQSIDLPMCGYVGNSAFYDCISLQSIDLPMCSYVGSNAFTYCLSLTSVNLPICENVGSYCFLNCSSLTSVNLPKCSRVYFKAFQYCRSLQSIDLPMCSYVGSSAFAYCSSLTSVNLPMCEKLGDNAFWNTKLTTLHIGISTSVVCEIASRTFNNIPQSIFAPMSLVDAYKSAPYWSNYASKIYGI